MKYIIALLALLTVGTVHAQFTQQPTVFNAVTNNPSNSITNPANPLISLGLSNNVAVANTSLVAAIARTIPIGANGFGLTINAASLSQNIGKFR